MPQLMVNKLIRRQRHANVSVKRRRRRNRCYRLKQLHLKSKRLNNRWKMTISSRPGLVWTPIIFNLSSLMSLVLSKNLPLLMLWQVRQKKLVDVKPVVVSYSIGVLKNFRLVKCRSSIVNLMSFKINQEIFQSPSLDMCLLPTSALRLLRL